jgi:large subunit ribosomal protein L6
VTFAPTDESRFAKAMYGTARSVVAGMVKGVTDGYSKDLEIQGVGFKAALKGKQLDLALG